MERSRDWLAQAKRDLESAAHSERGGFHEWAAFAAQQAAEKGIKAVYQHLGGDAWGHSCTQLLAALLEEKGLDRPQLLDRGRLLDRFYIPARYPNGWDAGAPKDMIGERDSGDAIRAAEEILRFCEGLLA
ncbi:MAG: HEPN domain-containing protein [Planctomycetes bacterium]|nr:HEPN domain-containing protein [Planctomycetota bacterium]